MKLVLTTLLLLLLIQSGKIHSLFQLQCELEKEYLIMIVVVVSSILNYYNVIWDNVHHPCLRGKVFIMVIRCAFQEFFQYQVTTLNMILVALSCAFWVYFRFCDIMSWWIVKRMYINCIIKWNEMNIVIFIIVCVSLFKFCWRP